MPDYQLTPGFVTAVDAGTAENNPAMMHPVLQVLHAKSVRAADNGIRYRLIVSDGTHFIQSMLATQLNFLMDRDQVGRNSIIRLNKHITNKVPNKGTKLLILLELEVVAGGDNVHDRIGNPVAIYPAENAPEGGGAQQPHAPTPQAAPPQNPHNPHNHQQHRPIDPAPLPQAAPQHQSYSPYQNSNQPYYKSNPQNTTTTTSNANNYTMNQTTLNGPGSYNPGYNKGMAHGADQQIFPIHSLSPYQNKWTIRVRCMGKSDVRHFKNSRGEGKLFSVTFYDESGEIRATAFGDAVTQFYDLLQESGTYFVSKGVIKNANKQFNNTNNDYEMTLDTNTMITICNDPAAAPQINIQAVPLSELYTVQPRTSIDVLGVVKEVGDLNSITTKAGRPANKRDLTIVDTSGFQVRLTLWGKQAETFDGSDHPVIAVKSCQVGDFQGRSLSALGSSTILYNPDIPEAHQLKGWYERDAATSTFQQYTSSGPAGGANGAGKPSVTKVITAIRDEGLGMGEKADYVATKATVTHIKRDNLSYPACPTCNKKMGEDGGSWRCEKCDKMYPGPSYRYMLNFALSDFTGVIWVTAFNEQAEQLLGHKADEMAQLKQENEASFTAIIDEAMFKTYAWTLRCKQDTYNDESKVRVTAQSVAPIDFQSRIQELRDIIAEYQQSYSALCTLFSQLQRTFLFTIIPVQLPIVLHCTKTQSLTNASRPYRKLSY
ncbi:hypothetical protein SeLEV6574_g00408 [Synchytrium endobioticum]|uniref:Replication protein A subunit n=1 Tax=Synchytrium endobioticum TaxID=286115 RepID=A0A507DI64_9FUNG|nr:hypothetical protein SeLEV6574_g00408 [Synchytrium endobioticum]